MILVEVKLMIFSSKKVTKIFELLESEYPHAGCELDHKNVFELLVAVSLSAQTTDKSVNKVTNTLFEDYPTPQKLAEASQDAVIEHIHSIGMSKTKSKNIIAMSKKLVSDYNGQVPDDYDALVSLPGVGRKTANVVLAEGFGEQHIAVDTHVFRVANRIGLVSEKDVLKTELSLMNVLPESKWTRAHHLFIFHGRYCCAARNPNCENCPLIDLCMKVGVDV